MTIKDNNFLREHKARHQLHPMIHAFISEEHPPQIIVKGDGVFVTDIDGGNYLDGIGGLWNVNVGHNRAEVKAVLIEQMDNISYYSSFAGTTTAPLIALSAEIMDLAAEEDMVKVLFSTSSNGKSFPRMPRSRTSGCSKASPIPPRGHRLPAKCGARG
ncbi:aminotransferase class III-fold pyridoxal phosphate-dependent enzyme [Phyllobacterium phragmitis]|uniref:aminotransferase class III-fold pyridoxal phosphate-dependent enzyme n=1 Tax=Phyllobacterium phragmitis TaxID=2670329 RepID=UPI0018ED288B|nr:aminotransferase class III-fold pyridoxal phosphate-dependent enzyme [Phyllobacterium phragmitis]